MNATQLYDVNFREPAKRAGFVFLPGQYLGGSRRIVCSVTKELADKIAQELSANKCREIVVSEVGK